MSRGPRGLLPGDLFKEVEDKGKGILGSAAAIPKARDVRVEYVPNYNVCLVGTPGGPTARVM